MSKKALFSSKKLGVVATLASILPEVALAQTTNTTGLHDLFTAILGIFNFIVPFLVTIIVVFLIIAAFQFALSGGDEEKRKSARDRIVWGLVGVVLIFAIYSLVGLASGIFKWTGGPIPGPTPVVSP